MYTYINTYNYIYIHIRKARKVQKDLWLYNIHMWSVGDLDDLKFWRIATDVEQHSQATAIAGMLRYKKVKSLTIRVVSSLMLINHGATCQCWNEVLHVPTSSTPAGTACFWVACRKKPVLLKSWPFHQLSLPMVAPTPRKGHKISFNITIRLRPALLGWRPSLVG